MNCKILNLSKWDFASLFNYFKWINVSKLSEALGIAPIQIKNYKKNSAYISEAQAERIEIGLQSIANELKAIYL